MGGTKMKDENRREIIPLNDQPLIYVQIAQMMKKNRQIHHPHREISDYMIKLFSEMDLTGLDGHGLYWPKLPLGFLNLRDLSLFKHRFYPESDVEITNIFNQEAMEFKQREKPYIIKIVQSGNIITPLELATALQFGLIDHLPNDCFAVDGGLFFSLNCHNCKGDRYHWRVHSKKPQKAFKKIRVERTLI